MSGIPLALEGVGSVVTVSLALLVAFAVVGQGFAAALAWRVKLPRGISFRVALGIVIVVVTVPIGYLLQVSLRGLSYGLLILGALLSATWVVVRWGKSWRAGLRQLSHQELLLAGVAFIVLSPVAIFGLTYWTLDANDVPAYAAFANVWLSGSSAMDPGDFIVQHPDPYGQWAVAWGDFDKLGVTGVLTFSSALTGVLPMQLQTPITLVILFTTLGLVGALARKLGCSRVQGAAVAIMASLGLLPMTFLLNGQLGHIIAVLVLVLSIVTVQTWTKRHEATHEFEWSLVFVAGAAVFAAFMANFLVAASVFPVLITAWILLMAGSKRPKKEQIRFLVFSMATTVVLLAPFIGRHLEAVRYLGTGDIGPKYFLASPFGMIGLQWSLDSITQNPQVLILWFLVGVLACVLATRARFTTRWRVGIGAGVVAANGAALGLYLGFDNYGFAKWTSVVSVLLVPFVLSYLFRIFREHRGASWIAIGIAGMAVITATHMASSIPFVVPRALFSLVHDPRLTTHSEIAIDLGNYFEDGTAAAILSNSRIYVLKATHADGAVARPYEATLVRLDRVVPSPGVRIVPLNELYGLVERIR